MGFFRSRSGVISSSSSSSSSSLPLITTSSKLFIIPPFRILNSFFSFSSLTVTTKSTSVSLPYNNDDNKQPPSFNAIDRILLRFRNLQTSSSPSDDDVDQTTDNFLRREWVRPDKTVFPWGVKQDEPQQQQDEEEEEEKEKMFMKMKKNKKKKKKVINGVYLAEAIVGEDELRRLKSVGMLHLKDRNSRISIPKAGLTRSVLQKIHHHWNNNNELVKLNLNDLLTHNTNLALHIVQRRTGGLVIWRSGRVMWVYRGKNYQGPTTTTTQQDLKGGDGKTKLVLWNQQQPEYMTAEEAEFNRMLDDLGPRFVDWWSTGILPVDADLLPPIVPGYRTPLRLLPAGMHPRPTNDEVTNMRKLAKALPCHFALGRNRNLQGLASAILKLWEKSLVAKIAVKLGIQNTNNELMAQELKNLTGGTLLLRNKFYIVLYRGKDFVPTSVAAVLAERQKLTKQVKGVEEKVRRAADVSTSGENETTAQAGSLAKFYEARPQWARDVSTEEHEKMMKEADKARDVRLIKKAECKPDVAQVKRIRAERILVKIEVPTVPAGPDNERETITDEERMMFRAVGLRMKAYLQLGTHGVFDGVIENMHMHWRHRELVKLITKQKSLTFVEDTARLLEYESGGILVSIDRLPKGFSLIYYRGKSYRRPFTLRPRNPLTKAKALQHSIGIHRHEASQHITELGKEMKEMEKEPGLSKDLDPEDRCKEDQNQVYNVSEITQIEGSDSNDNDGNFDSTEDSDWDDLGPQIF